MKVIRHVYLLLLGLITSCQSQHAFLVVSDLHYNGTAAQDSINLQIVEDMNALQEKISPDFVWVLGDITNSGKEDEWNQYIATYGLNGEAKLKYPVFECFGNHDGNVDGYVRTAIKERNKNRSYKIHTDLTGLHYLWKRKGMFFINLNLYPANEWDAGCDWCKYFKESFREAQYSLSFLKECLSEQVKSKKIPVIIAFHIGYDDFGLKWWTDTDRDKFHETIKDYNVVAIFHGHNHQIIQTNNNGIATIGVGAPQTNIHTGNYIVVRKNSKTKQLEIIERKSGGFSSEIRKLKYKNSNN